jgi:hypothetical protein
MLLLHQPAWLIDVDIRRGFIKRTVIDIFGGNVKNELTVLITYYFVSGLRKEF